MLDARTLALLPILGACSMFLSTVEYLFPKPLPFMRLGLANLPVLIGLEVLSPAAYVWLVVLKVLGQAIVNGTLASYVFLFSLAGSVASAAVMLAAYRVLAPRISFLGVSLFGSLASNATQIALSVLFIFGPAAWRILPTFLAVGIGSGAVIGIVAQRIADRSRWWNATKLAFQSPAESAMAPEIELEAGTPSSLAARRPDILARRVPARLRLWIGIAIMSGYLAVDALPARLALIGLFVVLVRLAGKRVRVGYFCILTVSIVFFHLLSPSGRILGAVGPLTVTSGALHAGTSRALGLIGIVLVSLFSVSRDLRLPGRLGGLIVRSFVHFERILESGRRPSARDFVASLDEILLDLFPPGQLCGSRPLDEGRGDRPRSSAG